MSACKDSEPAPGVVDLDAQIGVPVDKFRSRFFSPWEIEMIHQFGVCFCLEIKFGNSLPKLTPASMAFSSCLVTNGKAIGFVTYTGMRTRVGGIAAMLDTDSDAVVCGCLPDTTANQTPMQARINELGLKIGYGAIVVCFVVFLTGVILDRKDETDPDRSVVIYMIMVAVTLAVAAIPEGIPLCVTISLSTGCDAMVKRNVLIRRLAAVETLGRGCGEGLGACLSLFFCCICSLLSPVGNHNPQAPPSIPSFAHRARPPRRGTVRG